MDELKYMEEVNFNLTEQNSSNTYAEFIIEPLQPGYGSTLGHSFRRVLLSSVPGAAVTSVKINGVKHRFSTISGVKENVVDLLLNIKQLNFKLSENKDTATVKLSVSGPKDITAADLEVSDGVEIVDPEQYIAHVSDSKTKLEMELTVERGYGYSLAADRKTSAVGIIITDAVFSPVKRVSYQVESTRVGRQTNLDKLTLQVWTNGSLSPREAIDNASKTLATYFLQIVEPKAALPTEKLQVTSSANDGISNDVLNMTVDELDLPTRIYNSLRNGGIETIGQLITAPRKELVSMRNMGGKSISIIEEKLEAKGVTLSV